MKSSKSALGPASSKTKGKQVSMLMLTSSHSDTISCKDGGNNHASRKDFQRGARGQTHKQYRPDDDNNEVECSELSLQRKQHNVSTSQRKIKSNSLSEEDEGNALSRCFNNDMEEEEEKCGIVWVSSNLQILERGVMHQHLAVEKAGEGQWKSIPYHS